MLRSLHGFQCRGLIKLIPPGSKRRPQTITFLYPTLTSSVFIIRNRTCKITCTNKLDTRIHSFSAETMHALTQSKQTSSKCSLHTMFLWKTYLQLLQPRVSLEKQCADARIKEAALPFTANADTTNKRDNAREMINARSNRLE